MASALDEATQRSSLSLSNQMEMLTFRLTDLQYYAINVFKIIEIIECPHKIDRMPQSHPAVRGVLDFRGSAIPVIDLSEAVGLHPKNYADELAYVIVCEYSRQLTAFIVHSPETLLTRSWSDIHKPDGVNASSLVAIAYGDHGETIMLLDIESILADIIGVEQACAPSPAGLSCETDTPKHVILLDDSRTARLMLRSVIESMGYSHTSFHSADQAISYLLSNEAATAGNVDLIISDIEMPGIDGFTFTRTIKEHPQLRRCKVMLHSSMSNPSNRIKAEQAGADDFVAKFDPGMLAEHIRALISREQ